MEDEKAVVAGGQSPFDFEEIRKNGNIDLRAHIRQRKAGPLRFMGDGPGWDAARESRSEKAAAECKGHGVTGRGGDFRN